MEMKKYEKPLFHHVKGFDFTPKTVDSEGHVVVCRQCSACHGCR